MLASGSGELQVTKVLLDAGADVHASNVWVSTHCTTGCFLIFWSFCICCLKNINAYKY